MTASKVPVVAAAAGWMEQFHMPMRQIQKKFTKSEMVIMSWRSAEIAVAMSSYRERGHDGARGAAATEDGSYGGDYDRAIRVEKDLVVMGEKLGPIANKMVNERGEIDLRRLSGPEALRYMAALGIPVGIKAVAR